MYALDALFAGTLVRGPRNVRSCLGENAHPGRCLARLAAAVALLLLGVAAVETVLGESVASPRLARRD